MKSAIRQLAFWSAAATVFSFLATARLHAAITDADLAKVTQFIQDGKTERAKAEITILLDDNPNDPNATKMRKILDSLSTPGVGSAPSSPPPTSSPSGMTAEQRLEMNTFVIGIKQAMEEQDNQTKRDTLQALLKRDSPFQLLYIDQIPYWRMRATAALELDDYGDGWAAGSNLKKLGALDSSDPEIVSLMAKLNLKGWLENTREKVVAERFSNLVGTWTAVSVDERVSGQFEPEDPSGELTISVSDSGATVSGVLEYSKNGLRGVDGYGYKPDQKHLKFVANSIDLEKGIIWGEFSYEYTQLGGGHSRGKFAWTYHVENDPDSVVESWTAKAGFFEIMGNKSLWANYLHVFQKSPQGALVTGFYLKKR